MSAWTLEQVAQHNSPGSCWVIIQNRVYDVTDFLPEHPGGAKIILKYAGRDATAAYEPIHPPDALVKNLSPAKHLGPLSAEASQILTSQQNNHMEASRERGIFMMLFIQVVTRQTLSSKARAYYTSASDDEISHDENARAFSRFFFNARVMRPVAGCDPSTRILGYESSIPVFVSGAALAKLGHPDGEANITRAAAQTRIIQMVSSNASLSYSDIMEVAAPSQTLFFQLYKHANDSIAEQRVREVVALGYKAIFLTVDAIVAGNRERDIRNPWEMEDEEKGAPTYWSGTDGVEKEPDGMGTAGALVANDDRDMTWERTIPWLRGLTKLPIVIKGIQCVEDAVLAAEAGVDGILLSNHGGRQLEYSMPPLEVLYRLRLRRPDVFNKVEVYIDGGINRGTDVVKALCLGARAVGLGRAFLYAQSAYGTAGVVKLVQILRREIVSAMRLVGASTISDLHPEMVRRYHYYVVSRAEYKSNRSNV
ncbi:Cytochrome b2, mitochondrial [Leucoagaricus sp. SymC.cos]|nr:Cytochrome b2, mitochondrial [Leucoagaricus sp. SymC.cos]